MDLSPKEKLLKRIEELEAGQAKLKQEMSDLIISRGHGGTRLLQQRFQSESPQRLRASRGRFHHERQWGEGSASFRRVCLHRGGGVWSSGGGGGNVARPDSFSLTDMQYLNILQSMGQAVHILDCNNHIIYWNRMAEKLYGYTAVEAIDQNVIKLLTDIEDYGLASHIIDRVVKGASWTGIFPVRNKAGKRFHIVATDTPFYDDDGKLIGLICVSSDSQCIQQAFDAPSLANQFEGDSTVGILKSAAANKPCLDPQKPLQDAITLQATEVTSKVSIKVRSITTGGNIIDSKDLSGDSHRSDHCFTTVGLSNNAVDTLSSMANTSRVGAFASPFQQLPHPEANQNGFGRFYRVNDDEKDEKFVESRACGVKQAMLGYWKGNDPEVSNREIAHSGSTGICSDCKDDLVNQRTSSFSKQETGVGESQHSYSNEVSRSALSVLNINSTSSASSIGSTSSCTLNKMDFENDCLDYEVLWEDFTIGEQIGQGSCGIVYHALLYGSDVAVKVFSKQEYSEDVILSFRQEISIMKRLRHPNVLLFMGAVSSPERLCIITEFLPRGSLFQLLRRNDPKLDWRKLVQMALDIARGMNYLHHFNPPIIHRDLKSSNLLVDRNWTLKVGDFGLSRLKHEAYLTTRTGRGTPQWMAPEVLRNEPSDEKSDVYSYGVVLWEILTLKIPWENYNSIQVVSVVGYMDQRLEIPDKVDPQWASIIESCWHSDPQCRPTFQELLDRLKDVQRQYFVRLQSARSRSGTAVQKKWNTD